MVTGLVTGLGLATVEASMLKAAAHLDNCQGEASVSSLGGNWRHRLRGDFEMQHGILAEVENAMSPLLRPGHPTSTLQGLLPGI